MSTPKKGANNTSLKREITELLDDESQTNSPSPPRKKMKVDHTSTPILTPPSGEQIQKKLRKTKQRHHHHQHPHDDDEKLDVGAIGKAMPIVRCMSGHGMVASQFSQQKHQQIPCQECRSTIPPNTVYYRCPKDADQYAICLRCWKEETSKYTGAIALGQRVRIKIKDEYKLGSILKHWADDDTYTIQLDGQSRNDAEAYDIYDEEWNVQLVDKDQLKPTPTRMLSVQSCVYKQCYMLAIHACICLVIYTQRCDTDFTPKTVPRCLSGCRMKTMDAECVYDDEEHVDVDMLHKPDELGQAQKRKKLEFDSNEEEEEDDAHDDDEEEEAQEKATQGIYCNKCGIHVPNGKVYHCSNKSHEEGYDLCMRCSKKECKKPPQLTSYDLRGLADFIASGKCKKVAILCGAGISRSAGIPDFRSPDGIYKSLSKDLTKDAHKYGLTLQQKKEIENDAQYVFSTALFQENPVVLYHVLGDILNKRCKPTLTHCFFKLLQDRGLLRYLFTQNVDGLERYIGIDPKVLTEVHGTFMTASCFQCGKEHNIANVREAVKNGDIPIACKKKKKCQGGYVKPDCVLFGQDLPEKYYDAVDVFNKHKDAIDLLLIMGTSLSVKPVSDLPHQVNPNCIRAMFNLETSEEIDNAFVFEGDGKNNQRDILVKGKCDESVEELCKILKWDKELKQIYERSNALAEKISVELNENNKQKE